MHKDIKISSNAKKTPETISCYNKTKNIVDAIDQMAKVTQFEAARVGGQCTLSTTP